MPDHICTWWVAYSFDNPIRSFFHKPQKIFSPYLKPGMTIADIGCGMGFFSIGLAKILEGTGTVIAIDVQQKMLEIAQKRAEKAGVSESITFLRSQGDTIPFDRTIDFALAFWMAHETPDIRSFFAQIHASLTEDGVLFLAEPRFHVSEDQFEQEITCAAEAGFTVKNRPDIAFSHTAVLGKDSSEPSP